MPPNRLTAGEMKINSKNKGYENEYRQPHLGVPPL